MSLKEPIFFSMILPLQQIERPRKRRAGLLFVPTRKRACHTLAIVACCLIKANISHADSYTSKIRACSNIQGLTKAHLALEKGQQKHIYISNILYIHKTHQTIASYRIAYTVLGGCLSGFHQEGFMLPRSCRIFSDEDY